jgi:hypothetical protein
MKYLSLIYIFLFFCIANCYCQVQPLKKFNFNQGGYTLLAIYNESDPNSLRDSLQEFYIDDISVLNEIKQDWIFTVSSPKYACGYHYEILICKEHKVLQSYAINLNCHEIVTDSGYYYFDSEKLRKYYRYKKRVYSKWMQFDSIQKARDFSHKLSGFNGIIFTPEPNWINYEGSFRFAVSHPMIYDSSWSLDEMVKKTNIFLDSITSIVKSAYPGENFELRDAGGSLNEIDFEIFCNKSLEQKFTLFKRGIPHDWEPLELNLTYYSKTRID